QVMYESITGFTWGVNDFLATDQWSRLPLVLVGPDTLTGYSGDDWMMGFYGQNVMTGGTGDDTYIGLGDVIELPGQGYDTVITWEYGTYTLPANVEKLESANNGLHAIGNALDNLFEVSASGGT